MVTIQFTATWTEIEPDGSKCFVCGDNCYLTQFGLCVFVNGQQQNLLDPIAVACGSCIDVL